MIDHVGIEVADYARSRAFYERVLATLGHGVVMDRSMAAILLVAQHLARLAQGTDEGEGRFEGHGRLLALHIQTNV